MTTTSEKPLLWHKVSNVPIIEEASWNGFNIQRQMRRDIYNFGHGRVDYDYMVVSFEGQHSWCKDWDEVKKIVYGNTIKTLF